jgi:hypothetical protein
MKETSAANREGEIGSKKSLCHCCKTVGGCEFDEFCSDFDDPAALLANGQQPIASLQLMSFS